MKELKAYLNESKGAPLNMRTPGRLQGDPLQFNYSKNANAARQKILNKIDRFLIDKGNTYRPKSNGNVADLINLDYYDGDPCIIFYRPGLEDVLSSYYIEYSGTDFQGPRNFTSAQKNALAKLDMYAVLNEEGPQVYIDDADDLAFQLNKKFAKTAKQKYKYNVTLNYEAETDCFFIWFDEDLDRDLWEAPNSENEKRAEKFADDMVTLFFDTIDAEMKRIFPK